MTVEVRHNESAQPPLRPEPGGKKWLKEAQRRAANFRGEGITPLQMERRNLLKLELETLGADVELLQKRAAYSLASDIWIEKHPVITKP